MKWTQENGVIDSDIDPNHHMTRNEVAVSLYKVAKALGYSNLYDLYDVSDYSDTSSLTNED